MLPYVDFDANDQYALRHAVCALYHLAHENSDNQNLMRSQELIEQLARIVVWNLDLSKYSLLLLAELWDAQTHQHKTIMATGIFSMVQKLAAKSEDEALKAAASKILSILPLGERPSPTTAQSEASSIQMTSAAVESAVIVLPCRKPIRFFNSNARATEGNVPEPSFRL